MFFEKRNLEFRARIVAAHAHASIGQKRRYTKEPYIVHPAAVALIVKSVPHTEIMLAAAWLHDTVEDTPKTLAQIRHCFGDEVADLVDQLTDVSRPSDGSRAQRRKIDRLHTACASPAAKTIKLADLIDNTKSIVAHDRKFAAVYLREKMALLEVLTEGDSHLWAMAYAQTIAGLGLLEGRDQEIPT